jgi:hypothetical protein
MGGGIKHYAIGLVVLTLLVSATRVVIDIEDTVAYVLCAVAAGVSGTWFLLCPDVYAAPQFLAVSLLTLYQSHFVIEEKEAKPWIEWIICGVAVMIFVSDFYLWIAAAPTTTAAAAPNPGADAKHIHAVITNAMVASMGYVPVYGAGLFKIKQTWLLGVLVVLQMGLGMTEQIRVRQTASMMRTTHPAIKCLPLLYLPAAFWPLFGMFLFANIVFYARVRARIAKSSLASDPVPDPTTHSL